MLANFVVPVHYMNDNAVTVYVAEDVGVLYRFHVVVRRHVQQDVARSLYIHQYSTQ